MGNIILAIVGMCGSGKSVASDILEDMGFKKVYFGGVTMEKLKEENIPITPDNEKNMREKLRKLYGMGAFAKILLPKISELSKDCNVVLDGLYSWDELKILKDEFKDKLIVISIVADKKIRYDRLKNRCVRPLTYDEAENRDIAEIENIAKGGPIAYADYYIENNYDLDRYGDRIMNILEDIKKEGYSNEKVNW